MKKSRHVRTDALIQRLFRIEKSLRDQALLDVGLRAWANTINTAAYRLWEYHHSHGEHPSVNATIVERAK